ncbi:MAG: Glutamine--fructose-6-phosphate aminotransferase [isomerizing] [Chlamydiia bacterium]|nr:Glutamine--fructose-6-phosphate aminotransferase [isomerizing] [Chlamydiia bacterium]
MCGIFGYVGSSEKDNPVTICIEGLKNLEYRGYDSAGIAGLINGKILAHKTVGRIQALEDCVSKENLKLQVAIAHTRWATHGKPTKINAHPHFDSEKKIALVHNGIIENFKKIKDRLVKEGVNFESDTDTEVIVHLLSHYYESDMLEALQRTLEDLEGSLAIAIVHKDYPNQIFAAARENPLAIGFHKGTCEAYLSSDPNALRNAELDILYLHNNEIAVIKPDEIDIFNIEGKKQVKETEKLELEEGSATKDGYEHFMLKEIFQQPATIQKAMENRISDAFGTAHFEDLTFSTHELQSVNRILILACGTSLHAGYVAASLLENIARIPTEVEIASEFRYANPIISENTLVIAISQSGETADTIAAVREVKAKGAKIIGVCNVKHSTLTREADSTLFLKAGPEISVCSTKAFTSQLTLLSLFTLFMARLRHLSKEDGQDFVKELRKLPMLVSDILEQSSRIEELGKKYSGFEHFFFLGRRYMYPTSLEAALKLKEISYVNATGYPAGELKHGPIALINENLATIAMCGNKQTFQKLLSNIEEVKARNGPILCFANEEHTQLEEIADDVFYLPEVMDTLACIPYSIAAQLFSYYIAKERGTDIDKPRNLAKSVTVE